jgi:acetyl/propionyl-CoA carboxylase alpha subunit
MPAPGTVTAYQEPRLAWVRVDSACYEGYQILPFYDSLLAKLVVWGKDRDEAIARSLVALTDYKIEGVATTIPFHKAILQDPVFLAGEVDTKYVEAEFMPRFIEQYKARNADAAGLSASQNNISVAPPEQKRNIIASPSSLAQPNASQTERMVKRTFEVEVNQKQFKVALCELVSEEEAASRVSKRESLAASVNQQNGRLARPLVRQSGARKTDLNERSGQVNETGEVVAAMHGLVKELFVKEGDLVTVGQRLLILEAMKMESEVISDRAGRVSNLVAKVGETVDVGSRFMTVSTD